MSNYFPNMNSFDIHYITLLDNLEMEGMEGYFRSKMHRKKRETHFRFHYIPILICYQFCVKKTTIKAEKILWRAPPVACVTMVLMYVCIPLSVIPPTYYPT